MGYVRENVDKSRGTHPGWLTEDGFQMKGHATVPKDEHSKMKYSDATRRSQHECLLIQIANGTLH